MYWEFSEDGEWVERECLLFETGSYPDKGVEISSDDLRAIAHNSDRNIPMKIEHLSESPFDRALGVVTQLRVVGEQLWGTLRQPVEAWRMAQRAGARALSVALDVAGRKVVETSFVCRPRVASAQVFSDTDVVHFSVDVSFSILEKERESMGSVRQFAEGLMAYLRGVTDREPADIESSETTLFAEEMRKERDSLRAERARQQVWDWKRRGWLRGSQRAEELAQTLLSGGEANVVKFGEEESSFGALFAEFVKENGPVMLLGEMVPADRSSGRGAAGERLSAMAQERSRREGIGFMQAFSEVATSNPDLARECRE